MNKKQTALQSLLISSLFVLGACGDDVSSRPSQNMSALFTSGQSSLTAEYTQVECNFLVNPGSVTFNVTLSKPTTVLDDSNELSFRISESSGAESSSLRLPKNLLETNQFSMAPPLFSSDAISSLNILFSQLSLTTYRVEENLSLSPGQGFPNHTSDLVIGSTHDLKAAITITQDTLLNPGATDGERKILAQDIEFECQAEVFAAEA